MKKGVQTKTKHTLNEFKIAFKNETKGGVNFLTKKNTDIHW